MKGRGKEERLANQTIEGAIAAETEWFSNRSEYDDVATRCGTENVRNCLQNILCNCVIDNLQNVEEEILSTYERYRKRFSLLSIPDECKTEEDASEVIFSAITGITREFHNWMENGNPDDVERVLSGGAYVKYIIKESYDKHIKPLDCLRNYTDEMIYYDCYCRT